MKRIIELILAAIGAILCIGGAASIWILQAETNPPGVSMFAHACPHINRGRPPGSFGDIRDHL